MSWKIHQQKCNIPASIICVNGQYHDLRIPLYLSSKGIINCYKRLHLKFFSSSKQSIISSKLKNIYTLSLNLEFKLESDLCHCQCQQPLISFDFFFLLNFQFLVSVPFCFIKAAKRIFKKKGNAEPSMLFSSRGSQHTQPYHM